MAVPTSQGHRGQGRGGGRVSAPGQALSRALGSGLQEATVFCQLSLPWVRVAAGGGCWCWRPLEAVVAF